MSRRLYDLRILHNGDDIRDGELTTSLDLDDEREADRELYDLLMAAVLRDRSRPEDIGEYLMEVRRQGGGRPLMTFVSAYRRDR
jgi:hypothetical protein